MKKLFSLLKEERGSAIVIVLMSLVILLGSSALVMDYGMMAVTRRNLVNAADAAALAGAQELIQNPGDREAARNAALEYALNNGVDPSQVEVEVEDYQVRVQVSKPVPFTFARVLGFSSGTVSAEATAATGAVTAMTGIAPLANVDQPLIKGQEYQLKIFSASDPTFGPGNFGALALGGRGSQNYEKNLRDGYEGQIKIGDFLETETGNMSNPTRRAFDDRVSRCTSGCTFDNFTPNCPLILYMPIIRQPDGQGRQEVEVVGFAAFFLNKDAPPGQGNESIIKGWFIDTVAPGQITPGASGYGVSAVNLVK